MAPASACWPGRAPSGPVPGLEAVVRAGLGPIRTQFGRFARQGSGYALEHLLPERGGDLARALVGSEGTLAVVLGATVRLVRAPAATVLVVLGYPDMATAADAVGTVLPHAAGGPARASTPASWRWSGAGAGPCPSCPRGAAGCWPSWPGRPRPRPRRPPPG